MFGSLIYVVCKVFGSLVWIELLFICKSDSHFLRIWKFEVKSEMRENMCCNVLGSFNCGNVTSIYRWASLFWINSRIRAWFNGIGFVSFLISQGTISPPNSSTMYWPIPHSSVIFNVVYVSILTRGSVIFEYALLHINAF